MKCKHCQQNISKFMAWINNGSCPLCYEAEAQVYAEKKLAELKETKRQIEERKQYFR